MVGQEGRNWSTAEKYFSFLFVQGRNFHQKISLIYVGHFLNIFLLNMIGQYLLSALPKSSGAWRPGTRKQERFSFLLHTSSFHLFFFFSDLERSNLSNTKRIPL